MFLCKKIIYSNVFLLVFILLSFGTCAGIMGNRKIATESDRKIIEIEKIVERSLAQNADNQDYDAIKNAIFDEVDEMFPIEEGKEIIKVDFKKFEEEAKKKSWGKYPLTIDQIEEKYKKEAEEKFTPAEMNENLTVEYKIGRDKLVKVSGEYRGLNRYRNGIKIGSETVPLFDLLPQYRAKFVKGYRKLVKLTYIKESGKKYLSDRERYNVELITDSIKQVGKDNEAAGYINAWNNWRSPESVADTIFNYHLVKIMKKNKELAEQNLTAGNDKTAKSSNGKMSEVLDNLD